MTIEELQTAIDLWDDILTHHPNSDLAILTATLPIYAVLEAARLVANPNIKAAIAKHNELYPVPLSARGEEWLRQIVAAALTSGDTK